MASCLALQTLLSLQVHLQTNIQAFEVQCGIYPVYYQSIGGNYQLLVGIFSQCNGKAKSTVCKSPTW